MDYETLCEYAYESSFSEDAWESKRRHTMQELSGLYSDLETMLTAKDKIVLENVEYLLDEISILLDCKRSTEPVSITRAEVA